MDAIYDRFRSFEHFSEKYELYAQTVQSEWQYTQARPYKGDTLKDTKRMYIHLYYNLDKATEDEAFLGLWIKAFVLKLRPYVASLLPNIVIR